MNITETVMSLGRSFFTAPSIIASRRMVIRTMGVFVDRDQAHSLLRGTGKSMVVVFAGVHGFVSSQLW